MTAFLHFVTKNAHTYKLANPGIPHKEVISRMGSMWKNFSDDEKKNYNMLAEKDKKNYDDAKKAYL